MTRHQAARYVAAFTVLVFLVSAVLVQSSRIARHHVAIEVFNIDDYAQVFVNCRQVHERVLQAGERRSLDLGWLKPQDRITFQSRNGEGDYAWGFRLRRDGKIAAVDARGIAGPGNLGADGGRIARQHDHTHRRTYTASGDLIGDFGCQGAGPLVATPPDPSRSAASWNAPAWTYAVAGWLIGHFEALLVLLGAGILGGYAYRKRATSAVVAIPVVAALFLNGNYALLLKCWGAAAVCVVIWKVMPLVHLPGGDGPAAAP